MTLPGLDELVRRFTGFTAPYLDRAGDGAGNVRLKIDHTLRVTDIARQVAGEEGFGEPAASLCAAAALFHDIGRFPQYERWGVFNDAASENHARLGVRALLSGDMLAGFDVAARRVILGSVFLHNVRSLPQGLPPLLDLVARTVRDADKLDIYPVMLAHLGGDRPPNKVVTLGIEPHPTRYTPSIAEHVFARRIAPYTEMRWHNDFKLLVLSWVYDLNHTASLRLLHERGHVETTLAALPADPLLDRIREQVRADLHSRI